jgi:hypothetical protein
VRGTSLVRAPVIGLPMSVVSANASSSVFSTRRCLG